ncbi:TAXI family TRAP transporter solute-binding subunit [Aliiruegeria haliotis]|nr:TAXI family TRAP transporter solute-binding subunit [Aliiruegeria haliotis]
MMRSTIGLGVAAAAMLAATSLTAETIKMQAEEPGSSIYLYAGLFEAVIEKATDLDIEIIPRGGSVANTAATSMGKTDFGFANGLPVAWGAAGILDFEGKKQENNRLVFSGMQVAYLVAAGASEYVEKSGADTVAAALTGDDPVKVLVEPTGSINPVVLDLYLKSQGTDLDAHRDAGHVVQVPSSQMGQRVQDGFANGIFTQGPIGNPDLTEVMLAEPMTFLTWSESDLAAMKDVGYVAATMPAGSYDGQDADYTAPAALNDMIVNKDVDEEVVYQVTKAIIENQDELAAANQAFATWDPEAFIQPDYHVVPLHPGAERYYRERGWLK